MESRLAAAIPVASGVEPAASAVRVVAGVADPGSVGARLPQGAAVEDPRYRKPLSPHERSTAVKTVEAASSQLAGPEDEAAVATPLRIEDSPPPVIDESAEAEFLAEAKQRGEVVPRRNPAETEEESNPKTLPPLDDLVQRIPADVRETLEDLFRVKFVRVQRMPKKAFKPQ